MWNPSRRQSGQPEPAVKVGRRTLTASPWFRIVSIFGRVVMLPDISRMVG